MSFLNKCVEQSKGGNKSMACQHEEGGTPTLKRREIQGGIIKGESIALNVRY